MNARSIFLLCFIVAVASAAVTKSMFPDQVTKTVTVEKLVKNDIQTTTHTVEKPDGTIDTTVVTVDKSQSEMSKSSKLTTKSSKINISALMATDFSVKNTPSIYGVSVQTQLIGPITVGAFGLSNSVVGLSVGINF